jgi:hypothetical protein
LVGVFGVVAQVGSVVKVEALALVDDGGDVADDVRDEDRSLL